MDCARSWRGEDIDSSRNDSAIRTDSDAERVGLFGGCFDPPHIGHVALVEAALDVLQLSEVWVVPAGQPVHRSLSGCATPYKRLRWMQKIFAGHARVRVLGWEVAVGAATPSILTLRRFAAGFPNKRPVLLLGADAFAGMDGWVEYPEHTTLCDVAVFGRAASKAGDAGAAFHPMPLSDWLGAPAGVGRRVDVDASLPDVSATELRDMAMQGKSLAGRVAECVRPEIEQAYAAVAV